MTLEADQFDRVFVMFKQLCDCKAHVSDSDLLSIVRTVQAQ